MTGRYKSVFRPELTSVSNKFIDEYMSKASGDYVKVYLCFLRLEQAGREVDFASLAELSGLSEGDVKRALSYWEGAGVMEADAEYAETRSAAAPKEQSAKNQKMDQYQEAEKTVRAEAPAAVQAKSAPVKKDYQVSISSLDNDPDFKQLLYIAEMYLNKILTSTDCQILANLYGGLGINYDLLEYLLEYCANTHHTTVRYAEAVALSWHEKGIRTVEEAKAFSKIISKDSYSVMKAMGLTGRGPGVEEIAYIDKWFREYGFSSEIVVEACTRTLKNVHHPDFNYADAILTGWKKAGVIAKRDIEELDRQHRERAKAPENMPSRNARVSGNRFHNLEQHGYDYDDMVWNMINSGPNSSEG